MISARAREQLRQERETFDQAKRHDARWFGLRLTMGYATILLFLATAPIAGYVVLRPTSYSVPTIVIAAITLLGDMLGLVAANFKLVLRHDSGRSLRPVTELPSDRR